MSSNHYYSFIILLLVCFCFPNFSFAADNETGNTLLAECESTVLDSNQSPKDTLNSLVCMGYLEASLDTALYLGSGSKPPICPPNHGLTRGQLARIVVKRFKEFPEKLHEPAAKLVYDAWLNAFPCSKKM